MSVTTRPPPQRGRRARLSFYRTDRFQPDGQSRSILEHAKVFDNYYGTPRAPVEKACPGRDVLFDIDWQGTQQLAEKARDDLVSVFILPPSWRELERRLHGRGQDDEAVINRRMAKATDEMSHWAEYDYVISTAILINPSVPFAPSCNVNALNAAARWTRGIRQGIAGREVNVFLASPDLIRGSLKTFIPAKAGIQHKITPAAKPAPLIRPRGCLPAPRRRRESARCRGQWSNPSQHRRLPRCAILPCA